MTPNCGVGEEHRKVEGKRDGEGGSAGRTRPWRRGGDGRRHGRGWLWRIGCSGSGLEQIAWSLVSMKRDFIIHRHQCGWENRVPYLPYWSSRDKRSFGILGYGDMLGKDTKPRKSISPCKGLGIHGIYVNSSLCGWRGSNKNKSLIRIEGPIRSSQTPLH